MLIRQIADIIFYDALIDNQILLLSKPNSELVYVGKRANKHSINQLEISNKLEDVKDALEGIGLSGITVIEAKGFGRQKGHDELYQGSDYVVDFLPKVKIEIIVDDSLLEKAIEIIKQSAYSGKIGDGKIFVSSIDEVIRIRTGEKGKDAI